MNVLRLRDTGFTDISALFKAFGLGLEVVSTDEKIPGSHWGDEEAGLIGNTLFARADTPVHSALHEGCHWLLMDDARRAVLHTNAGGTMMEENAVCYLQLLLADRRAWFESDAEDALAFLQQHSMADTLRLDKAML